jgi:hypothetical protein
VTGEKKPQIALTAKKVKLPPRNLYPGFCSVLFALRDCSMPAAVAVVTPSDGVVDVHARRAILFSRRVKCDWLVFAKSLIPIGLGVALRQAIRQLTP